MPLKIVVLSHAKRRMRERKISLKQIRRALQHPDKINKDKTNYNRFLSKKFIRQNNKPYLLLVAFEIDLQAITIVTVITTSKIHKYF